MPEIVWKVGAEDDLLRVFSQLEDSSPGAGERFVLKLDHTLDHVRRNPEMAPVFEPPARRLIVGTTGFGLFYSVDHRGIIVHALVHLSQSPASIREKIRRLLDLS